jgi:hypothetical protein
MKLSTSYILISMTKLSLSYIYISIERERELLQKHKYQFYQNPKATNHKSNNENSSRKWSSGKSLGLRCLLLLKSQVRIMWLLIWWSLEVYIVINFRANEISRDVCKLSRTSTLIKKKIALVNPWSLTIFREWEFRNTKRTHYNMAHRSTKTNKVTFFITRATG